MTSSRSKRRDSSQNHRSTFRVPVRTETLTFEGTPWEGAEVTVRMDISVGMYLELLDMVKSDENILVARLFGDSILEEWNIVDEGGDSIPATGEGMLSLPDMVFALRIIGQWIERVKSVSIPLAPPSVDGNMLVAASTDLGSV